MTFRLVINPSAILSLAAHGGAVEHHMREIAEAVADEARNRAPVDTGELRDSIEVQPAPGGGGYDVVATADHAIYVEMGTYKMAAQPFLRPALDIVAGLR